MNFNIYLDEDLGGRLLEVAKESQKTRNGLIREAIDMWLQTKESNDWPEEIMQFAGVSGVPRFESYRDEFTRVRDDPFS